MKQLLTLTEGPDFVCFRYRVAAFRAALADRGWELKMLRRAKTIPDFFQQMSEVAAADAVLLQRRLLCWWKRRLLRRSAKKLLFDFDDALFLRDSNHHKRHHDARRWRRFRQTVRTADACLAGNDHLCEQATACGKTSDVHRIPTCVDHRLYETARHERTGRDVQLVWIGSRGTMDSLRCAHAGIVNATQRMPGLTLKVICDVFPELADVSILPVEWSSAIEAPEIAAADIGIAWLPDHPWSLGKCGLKTLQYMAAGLPVVANRIGVHHDLVIHGETGFLTDTPDEWGRAIEILANSPELRRRMGQAGRAHLIQHYSVERWAPQFAAIIDESASNLLSPLCARSSLS